MRFSSPEALSAEHQLGEFSCGELVLDEWLFESALKSQKSGTAQTYVSTVGSDLRVAGYFALAAGSIERDLAKGWLGRNSPDPVPVIVLARLAVDDEFKGAHLGGMLLLDAFERAMQATKVIGARAILVNPISEFARSFYLYWGFEELNDDPSTLFVRMSNVRVTLQGD